MEWDCKKNPHFMSSNRELPTRESHLFKTVLVRDFRTD
jgi:hypothetical protein